MLESYCINILKEVFFMKKALSLVVTAGLTMALSVPVFASEQKPQSADLNLGQVVSQFSDPNGVYPQSVEFGFDRSFSGVGTFNFNSWALGTSTVSRSGTWVVSEAWEYKAKGVTEPKNFLYSVSAQTSLYQKNGSSYTLIKEGNKAVGVLGASAESTATEVTPTTQNGSWRAYTQHSVAYGADQFIVYTAHDQTW